jgi:hypothetical protein
MTDSINFILYSGPGLDVFDVIVAGILEQEKETKKKQSK